MSEKNPYLGRIPLITISILEATEILNDLIKVLDFMDMIDQKESQTYRDIMARYSFLRYQRDAAVMLDSLKERKDG